jgi:ATP-dependent Clp protease ATP-binding subunit ClpB
VLFKPLTLREIEQVVEHLLDDLRIRLSERRMTLEVTEGALHLIAEEGFDPVYGARPLRRFIAHEVETRVARALLGGNVLDGATIKVTAEDGELQVEYENPPTAARSAA